jgi:hypothetical protein
VRSITSNLLAVRPALLSMRGQAGTMYDADRRYAVFTCPLSGQYVVWKLDRRRRPDREIGRASDIRDARIIVRLDRGPFTQRDKLQIAVGSCLLALMLTAVAATPMTLVQLIIALACLAGALIALAVVCLVVAVVCGTIALARAVDSMDIWGHPPL